VLLNLDGDVLERAFRAVEEVQRLDIDAHRVFARRRGWTGGNRQRRGHWGLNGIHAESSP
jgi:hypothetical protein